MADIKTLLTITLTLATLASNAVANEPTSFGEEEHPIRHLDFNAGENVLENKHCLVLQEEEAPLPEFIPVNGLANERFPNLPKILVLAPQQAPQPLSAEYDCGGYYDQEFIEI